MTIERAPQRLRQLLDDGKAEAALSLIAESWAEFAEDPRAILPVLEELDRRRSDDALRLLIGKIQELKLLPRECLLFDLRVRFRATDYAGALFVIDRILAIASDDVEALRTGGRIGNLTRNDTVAMRYWERLAGTEAGDSEAALQSARIRLRHEQFDQALRWATRVIERQPDLAEALQIAVTAGIETGWPVACDPLLVRLFEIDKPAAHKALSRLVRKLDGETVARALTSLRSTLATDQAYLEIIGSTYSGWLVTALELELASKEIEAAAHYRAARAVRPTDTSVQRALDRLSLPSLVAMREAFNNRDFAGAAEHGVMVTRINPDNPEAWQTVGRAQFARNNIAEASEAFRRCTELNARDARGWLTYGLALNQAGERSAALTAFQKALGLSDPEVKREAEASIAALYPSLVRDAHQAATEDKIDDAWKLSDAALTIKPGDAEMLSLRRTVLRQQREQVRQAWDSGSDSAVELSRRFLEKSPGDTYVATVLGRTLMRMRAYADALPVWEDLAGRNPGDSHNHLQVARCCRSLKIRDRGLHAAAAALRLDPALQEASQVADFLKGLAPVSGAQASR